MVDGESLRLSLLHVVYAACHTKTPVQGMSVVAKGMHGTRIRDREARYLAKVVRGTRHVTTTTPCRQLDAKEHLGV